MGHDDHLHSSEESQPLRLFASPLHDHGAPRRYSTSSHTSNIELTKPEDPHTTNHVPFDRMDDVMHDKPSFHRHAEATTAELFYDLFFVANLTTFTSILEINNHKTLTAYIGFFSLLWLTWYQVSLYDVRFSADSVFERVAKALHFGVMIGFAVMGPQWHPGQETTDGFKIYRAFGLTLMVSRVTLALQYTVTLWYTRKYSKTVLPLAMVIASTLLAAIFYGALTPAFPGKKFDADGNVVPHKSNLYIAWYIIAICETILTVTVSCIWRVISFKGTHMVQRMSLITLIILGEGIIVISKAISKIVKNEFLWTSAVIGQIIAAILIIYFLYMLYFDRLHEDHFGSIKQQIWSFGHFPLHIVLVLVLQGVSLLIIWTQAMEGLTALYGDLSKVEARSYNSGAEFANAMNESVWANVYEFVPKGVDDSKEIKAVEAALGQMQEAYDFLTIDMNNDTAKVEYTGAVNNLLSAATKTLFDSLSVSAPEDKKQNKDDTSKEIDFQAVFDKYVKVFGLVFTYVFVSGGLSLVVIAILGYLSLPDSQRRLSQYIRLGINLFCGVGLSLVATLKYDWDLKANFLSSAWMIPTILLVYFVCVVGNHLGLPAKFRRGKMMR
ncbi:hypothetical protein P280DRAFT_490167 [Massarina eburnea CBS 473.64]|uniref:Low temperature requirement A n=1 Tax=Massarina eburnea CBS 473.64 TaxID=1395130 RepID=A0A6A6S3D1_9PLEO|nr:hypothetical protein P280DRAFT_490167 [Massarina eburnea CBS 473.64]